MTTPMALSCWPFIPKSASTTAATMAPASAPTPMLKPKSSAAAAPMSASSLVACTEKDICRSTMRLVITPESTPSSAQAISELCTKSTLSRYAVSVKKSCTVTYITAFLPSTSTTFTSVP